MDCLCPCPVVASHFLPWFNGYSVVSFPYICFDCCCYHCWCWRWISTKTTRQIIMKKTNKKIHTKQYIYTKNKCKKCISFSVRLLRVEIFNVCLTLTETKKKNLKTPRIWYCSVFSVKRSIEMHYVVTMKNEMMPERNQSESKTVHDTQTNYHYASNEEKKVDRNLLLSLDVRQHLSK